MQQLVENLWADHFELITNVDSNIKAFYMGYGKIIGELFYNIWNSAIDEDKYVEAVFEDLWDDLESIIVHSIVDMGDFQFNTVDPQTKKRNTISVVIPGNKLVSIKTKIEKKLSKKLTY